MPNFPARPPQKGEEMNTHVTRRDFVRATAAATVSASTVRAADASKPGLWAPKFSENLADVNADTLRWLAQMGCKHVIFQGTDTVDADKKGYWTPADVRPHKKNCEEMGLILESMMIPIDFYRLARLGQPGRDKEIENVCRTIRAAADEGVPMME